MIDFALYFTARLPRNSRTTFSPNIQLFREKLSHKSVKANATTSKVIMGNGGFTSRYFSDREGNNANMCIHAFTFLLSKPSELRTSRAKLWQLIISIGIVAFAFTLFWDYLCRNNCNTKTNHESLSLVYPRLSSVTCNLENCKTDAVIIRVLTDVWAMLPSSGNQCLLHRLHVITSSFDWFIVSVL